MFLDVSCHVPWNPLEYSRKMFILHVSFQGLSRPKGKNWANVEHVNLKSIQPLPRSRFCLGKHAVSLRMDVVNLQEVSSSCFLNGAFEPTPVNGQQSEDMPTYINHNPNSWKFVPERGGGFLKQPSTGWCYCHISVVQTTQAGTLPKPLSNKWFGWKTYEANSWNKVMV